MELTQNELDNITVERDNLLEKIGRQNQTNKENQNLKTKIKSNQTKKNKLTKKIASLEKVGIFFREYELREFRRMIHELQQNYPNVPINELILISLSEKIEEDQNRSETYEKEYIENDSSNSFPYWKKISLFIAVIVGGLLLRFIVLKNKKAKEQKLIASIPQQETPQNNVPFMRYQYPPGS